MSDDRIAKLEERLAKLESVVNGISTTWMEYKAKIDRMPDDDDPPPLGHRVRALEVLAEKVARWVDRGENEVRCFVRDYKEAYDAVDWVRYDD